MQTFFSAPIKSIVIDEHGNVDYCDDPFPEEGVLTPNGLPKTQIQAPGITENNAPKGNHRDLFDAGFIEPNHSAMPDMKGMLQQGMVRSIDSG